MGKYDLFFKLAKEAGIEEAELYISTSYALSVSTFHGEIDNYSVEDGSTYVARGIVNGKFGAATCDVYNAEKAKYPYTLVHCNIVLEIPIVNRFRSFFEKNGGESFPLAPAASLFRFQKRNLLSSSAS